MKMKRLMEKYTPEELADAFVFRSKLTPEQQTESDRLLNEHRKKNADQITPEQKLYGQLLRLKFLLEDYIRGTEYNPEFSFSHFLREYIKTSYKMHKDFAKDIDIKTTELSQLLNKHREPNEKIIIRLEMHSNNIIPAISWMKLLEKEKEHEMLTNQSLRASESKHVRKLQLNLG